MTGQIVKTPGIFFRVRDPLTSQMVSWRRDVDEAVLRHQLRRGGQVLIVGLDGRGITHISEIPERGKVMPFYGSFGGGFTFTFHPAGEKTEITVEAVFGGSPIFHPDPIEPLELTAPQIMLAEAEVYENVGTTGPDDALTYLPEFLFGFYGKFMDIFRAWEWYSEDSEMYDFIFSTSSVGTAVTLRHRESGSLVELTRDVEW
jgi:hypothetical protein